MYIRNMFDFMLETLWGSENSAKMAKKPQKLIGALLEPVYAEKVEKICRTTKESKSDMHRRLIDNELAMIEGRHEDISNSMGVITEKKLDHIIKSLNSIESKTDRNFGATSFAVKMIFRTQYFITRLIHIIHRPKDEDIKACANASDEKAKSSFNAYYDKITNGLYSTIKYLKTQ